MPSTSLRILLIAFAGVIIGAVHQFHPFADWEEATVDLRLRLRPKKTAPGVLGIVAVNDEDLKHDQFGGWPFPRSVHADIVTILRALGSNNITFDVIFSDPLENTHDKAFAAILAEKDDTTLAYHFETLEFPNKKERLDVSEIVHFAEGKRYGIDVWSSPTLIGSNPQTLVFRTPSFGAVNVKPAANGVIRRVPMFIQNGGKLYPGLAMETLIRSLDLEPDQIRIVAGRQITLVDTPKGTLSIPVDECLQYRINYTSEISDFDPAFHYLDIYLAVDDPEMAALAKEAVEGKPVIIGNVSTGTSDVVTTPIGRLPGMLAQAMAITNILTQNHLKFVPSWIQVLSLGIVGLLLGLLLRVPSALVIVLTCFIVCAAYMAVSYLLARENWMIPVLPFLELTILSMVSALWFQIGIARGETTRTRKALQKYVSPSVAERALREEAFLKVENERREITIFFSDIRGFTNWSEKKEPEDITLVLNEYLGAMTDIVSQYSGTLDKFVGDCVMVIFNAPNEVENHAVRAVEMALAMQQKVTELDESWRARGRDPISVGMGINTGFATVGNFGSETYSDYTAIGNCVNLAARIEAISGPGEILVSESTRNRLRESFAITEHGVHEFKGVSDSATIYSIQPLK